MNKPFTWSLHVPLEPHVPLHVPTASARQQFDRLISHMKEEYDARIEEIRQTIMRVGGPLEQKFGGIYHVLEYWPPARYQVDNWKGDPETLKNFRPSHLWYIVRTEIYWTQMSFTHMDDFILFRLSC